ncbi:disintegrin and metalloproteinase domain-containing protein 19 isoform X2 [Xenopus laevis]|uniref:Disintegrin and metalloproteinase domain-containing protein 19 isoform X2 n=1 Tax=Xenopus laevis TaxID=8355 RepID=A0A8J1M0Q0_XENLA|nr:disintegrin and metalloproteinase domain-containing protein 19 isoform X2 [Xenopus laevis]
MGSEGRLGLGVVLVGLLLTPVLLLGTHQGERVTALWLQNGRAERSADLLDKGTPDRGEILVSSEGRQFTLKVERNHLLFAPGYTETHYTDGHMVTLSPNHTEHCYYHGYVRDYEDSSVALTTCSGISYYLKPLEVPVKETHTLVRTEHLPIKGGSCGHDGPSGSTASYLKDFTAPLAYHRVRRNIWRSQKYMELFIVADYSMFMKQNQNLVSTKLRVLEIANYVDKFYMSMNIKVALIGLEVWTERDQCDVNDDANDSLRSFLQWKQKLRSRKKHDNAQLITGVTFKGTTIGMAPLEGMCTAENSGGVSMDHSENAIGAAATMAHEIGHNFGMSHDNNGCCVEATPEQGGCIMAAATGHPFPRKFSSCSQQQLMSYFRNGGGMCLFNLPNTKDLVMGKKCGNGFLEEGEQCDCGEPEECANSCCNANNCTLKDGAECAHGECCQDCKLKPAGSQCREMAGSCDLPEFCTGDAPFCPPNVYILDGSSCAHGDAYCYNGMCLTHRQQCIHLWGSGAVVAPDICFQDVNKAGDQYGNCGTNGRGQFVKCTFRDAKCGKIQCQTSSEKPRDSSMVKVENTIIINGHKMKCQGVHVYSMQEEEGDPGLVMTGTKCGDGMVCRDRRCQNSSFFELHQCVSKCNGHGVCNSNRNCHCDSGWAPPYCDQPGAGGSQDSGPAPSGIPVGVTIFLASLFLVLLLALAFLMFYWHRKPASLLNKWLMKSKAKCSLCKATQPKAKRAYSSTVFSLRNISYPVQSTSNQTRARDSFQGKPTAAPNSSQPVNVVQPLRPAPGPVIQHGLQGKPFRSPPAPMKPSPILAAREDSVHVKLLPPNKPLPSCPIRTQQLNPPSKPLPVTPAHKEPLLVLTPATHKPPITNSATQLKGPHRPIQGAKVQAAVVAFLQRK